MKLVTGSNYREFCQLLEARLELKDCPDFAELSELECKAFANEEFTSFLEKGVHDYIPGYLFDRNHARETYAGHPNYEHEADPTLDAYYTFAKALDIVPSRFGLETLDECRAETFLLFQQFMYHGARSFASTFYTAYPNGAGMVQYRSDTGPLTPEDQKFFENMVKPLMVDMGEREKRLSEVRAKLYGRDEPSLTIIQRARNLIPWG